MTPPAPAAIDPARFASPSEFPTAGPRFDWAAIDAIARTSPRYAFDGSGTATWNGEGPGAPYGTLPQASFEGAPQIAQERPPARVGGLARLPPAGPMLPATPSGDYWERMPVQAKRDALAAAILAAGKRDPGPNDDPSGVFPEVQPARAEDADFMWRRAWPLQPLSSGPHGTAETKGQMLARILMALPKTS